MFSYGIFFVIYCAYLFPLHNIKVHVPSQTEVLFVFVFSPFCDQTYAYFMNELNRTHREVNTRTELLLFINVFIYYFRLSYKITIGTMSGLDPDFRVWPCFFPKFEYG